MNYNSNHLKILVFSLIAIVFSATIFGFSVYPVQPNRGNIEGYVFPRAARPRIIIAIPHPQVPGDTIHRVAIPNLSGYFKLNLIPAGTQLVIYEPMNRKYRSKTKTITVIAGQTVNAGSETLELEQ